MADVSSAESAEPFSITRVLRGSRAPLLVALIAAAGVAFSIAMPSFDSQANLINLLRQASVLAIVACGATFVIAAGEIDLSVGSLVAFVAVLTAWMTGGGYSIALILPLGLLAGLAVGGLNSLLVLGLGVPSFLATLGVQAIVRGAAMTLSLQPLPVRNLGFIRFFGWSPAGVPMPVLLAAIVGAVAILMLARTRFGIRTRAVGSNEGSARLAGLRTHRQKCAVLLFGSGLAAVAGVVLAGRTNYGMSQAGGGLELDAIAATLLGGGRLGGGAGSVVGTLLATILLTMIFTGIATLGISGSFQDIAKGLLVGIAIFLMRAPSGQRS
jgi:ribose/xylose/arabinose/galactoside ABC-type transport system permease subunit